VFVFVTCSSLPAIHNAINESNLELVQRLVEKGADVNERPTGRYGPRGLYPLERALEQKNYDIALFLLENGAMVTNDALRYANQDKRYDIVKIMVEKGKIDVNKDVFILSSIFRNEDFTIEQKVQIAIDIAGGNITNPSILLMVDTSIYQQIVELFKLDLSNKVDDLGRGLLHIAAERVNLDLVQFLLGEKVDINMLDDNAHTALFYAITAFGPSINWNEPIIENETSAKINFVSDMPFYRDPSGLQKRQVNIVMSLLDAGININQQDKWGWSVLHFANAAYPPGLQELLLSYGANKSLKTTFERTAVDILAFRK
jgi:ankyrin repeat protein